MVGARMSITEAASASLIAVMAFGLALASNYAWSGLIDWPIAILLMRAAPSVHWRARD